MGRRLIVIGAGPMGLEAALGAVDRGFDVTVFEKGEVGASLARAGSTRFFSPMGMNLSARAKQVLGEKNPREHAIFTAREIVDRVLLPLASSAPLAGKIHTHHRVVAISRARLGRMGMPNHPLRAERPFHVLVDTPSGERVFEAEHVLDASGVCDQPSFLGAGGMPARGERKLRDRFIQHLGLLDEKLPQLANKRVLLAGHGHSAANALLLLDRAARESSLKITWAVRTPNGRPCLEVANDPLPERREVVARANALAESPPPHLEMLRRAHVESIEEKDGAFLVSLGSGREGVFDEIAAFTGYRPDHSIVSELAVEISPVSDGAMRIHRALSNVTDCLNVPALQAKDLASGEPGFHFIGIKSYGRLPTFLLATGLRQLESILEMFAAETRG